MRSYSTATPFRRSVFVTALVLAGAANAQPAPAAAGAQITAVNVYSGSTQNVAGVDQKSFMLDILGKGLANAAHIIPFPSEGVSNLNIISAAANGTEVTARFTAPTTYSLGQIAVAMTDSSFVSFNATAPACDYTANISMDPQFVPEEQAKDKYGRGISSNFYVIQLSPVNKCSIPIDIPLAGIKVLVNGSMKEKQEKCQFPLLTNLAPFPLDHLTSIYTVDRQATGARAWYFNSLQAAATIGGAVEPFFAKGFTQAVAILGGGFTTASKQIFVDMSAQQLQDIATKSFPTTEQIAANGSDQKYIFVRRIRGCGTSTLEENLRQGNFVVQWEILQASATPAATQAAAATPSVAPATKALLK